jgi:hypothetical protein
MIGPEPSWRKIYTEKETREDTQEERGQACEALRERRDTRQESMHREGENMTQNLCRRAQREEL